MQAEAVCRYPDNNLVQSTALREPSRVEEDRLELTGDTFGYDVKPTLVDTVKECHIVLKGCYFCSRRSNVD